MNRSVLGEASERGFALRFAVLAVLLLTLPAIGHLLVADTQSNLRLVPAVVAAAIVIVAFVWWRVEALLAFALFVLFYDTLALYMGGPVRRFDEMTVPGLALIAAWSALPRIRRWWSWPREGAVAAFVLIGVASSLVNHVPFLTWGIQLVLLVKAIVFFYVALWTSARTFQVAAGMKIVLGVGLLVLGLGFVELINPIWFQETLHLQYFLNARGPLWSVKSLFFHPVLFSWFTALIAIFAWAWYLDSKRRLAFALAALFSLGPFLGQRRRAIAALFIALAAGFAEALARDIQPWRKVVRRWMPVGATMAVIVVLFIPLLLNLGQATLTNYIHLPTPAASGETPPPLEAPGEGEAPPQVRIALYDGAVEVARDKFPLGGGLGRWGSWMSRVDYSPLYCEYKVCDIHGLRPKNPVNVTDTFWPQIIGELGFIGLAAYLVYLGSLAVGLWRGAGRYPAGVLRVFTVGGLLILVQALIESLASPMFHSPPRAYLLYLVIGVAIAIGSRLPEDWREPDRAEPGPVAG
ncbi:MAG TPA: hypothetical protein VIA82_01990 [Candidatus Limnocylindria bacterium]